MLECVEKAFDAIVLGLHGEVSLTRGVDAGARRDDGFCAGCFDGIDDLIAALFGRSAIAVMREVLSHSKFGL